MSEEAVVTTPEAPALPEENPLAPDDPMNLLTEEQRDKVAGWKSQGLAVNMGMIAGDLYFFRTFNRLEWKKVMTDQQARAQQEGATTQSLQMALEDQIVLACSLEPKITGANITALPAGVTSTLADWIMYQSGFNQETIPVKL